MLAGSARLCLGPGRQWAAKRISALPKGSSAAVGVWGVPGRGHRNEVGTWPRSASVSTAVCGGTVRERWKEHKGIATISTQSNGSGNGDEQRPSLLNASSPLASLQRIPLQRRATVTIQGMRMHSKSTQKRPRVQVTCSREEDRSALPAQSRREEEMSMSLRAVVRALVGNAFITTAKFGAYFFTGSAAMLSEAIHTLVDTANQMLLYFGIQQARKQPDGVHHYGYGRNAFFYALLSGMGMFWVGSGAVLMNAAETLADLPAEPVTYGWLTWTVLLGSFAIDGSVLASTLKDLHKTKKPNESMIEHVRHIRDPMIKAVVYEDVAACTGVLLAIGGIGLSYATSMAIWDPLSSAGVGLLLGAVAVNLVRMNKSFLLGQSIEKDIEDGIESLLLSRKSVEAVYAVSNTWEGPSSFAYKADVDFHGSFFADQLEGRYLERFKEPLSEEDLRMLLREYSENLTRLIEKEVFALQTAIQEKYEEARFIEIQPHSTPSKELLGDAPPSTAAASNKIL